MKTLLLTAFYCTSLFMLSCQYKKPEAEPEQLAIINYLFHPGLISDTFCRMIYKLPIDCRGLDEEQQLLYFIYKKELSKSKGVQAIVRDTSKVEFAPCETGDCFFGGLKGNITGFYAFRTPVTNLRVPPHAELSCKLHSMRYGVSLHDIVKSLDSNSFYNTEKHFQLTSDFQPGYTMYASNIGAYISKRDKDPIITRLSNTLVKGLKTKEEKMQVLLHFVTNEIEYSYEDYWYETEITKRAHEVLISGMADCSGKSTLLASLLEAQDLPYTLLYFNRHVNIGVPGSFPDENGLSITIGKKKYYYAETTIPDFQIGKSMVESDGLLNKVYYYQKPQTRKYIYLVSNDQPLQLISEVRMQQLREGSTQE